MPRDIPADEYCPERPATFRESFGDLGTLSDLEAMRRKWADNLDRARERLERDCRHCGAFSRRCERETRTGRTVCGMTGKSR